MNKSIQFQKILDTTREVIKTNKGYKDLNVLIKEPVLIKKSIFDILNDSFNLEHELSFDFYSKNGIIDTAIDLTDYKSYEQSKKTTAWNYMRLSVDRLYKDAKEIKNSLTKEGQIIQGSYHTHPVTKDWVANERKNHKTRAEKNSLTTAVRQNFPSDGDVGAWLSQDEREGFIFIGHKYNLSKKLNIKAIVPVATFIESFYSGDGFKPSGHSCLKPRETNNWMKDTKIDRQEFRRLENLSYLSGATHVTSYNKQEYLYEQMIFFDVPVKIVK